MYCPSCGSNNLPDIKFCTRCGTNLVVVTEALTGKTGKPAPDDRVAKLLKDYYRGRRDTITGAVTVPSGLLIMAIMMAAGLKPIAAFFIICWMFFWGASALASGLGKLIAAKGELKALGYDPEGQFRAATFKQVAPGDQVRVSLGDYSTGPVGHPASVTEHTTRQLDERGYTPPPEREKEASH